VRFLIDSQLPVALARLLSSAGSVSLHVGEVGLAQAPDSEIWRYAADRQFILVSKDEDFFHRAARPGASVQLVWIRLGNCRKAALLATIEGTWPRVCACLQAGERIVEIR
jgi:predicted nuclease of predicted toxin-antitoxin system